MNRLNRAALTLVAAFAVIPSVANATVTVDVAQTGPNVVATATGSLNLTGLTNMGTFGLSEFVNPSIAYIGLGAGGSVTGYAGLTGPASFGPGGTTASSSFAGTSFALNGASFVSPFVFVPVGYVSGSAISGTATWLSQTIASLGLTPGQYTYAGNNDSVVINIGAVSQAPEPSTWAMMLLGFGAIGLAFRRRGTAKVSTSLA